MKFQWRLQRVLDIKQTEENTLKTELSALTEKKLSLKSKIMLINMKTNSMISNLSKLSLNQRLQRQSLTIEYSKQTQKEIAIIEKRIEEVVDKIETIKENLLEVRKYRKGLERLKEKAHEEFILDYEKKVQNEIDEITSITNARKTIEASTYV